MIDTSERVYIANIFQMISFIDSTMSKDIMERGGKIVYDSMSDEEQFILFKEFNRFKKEYESNWLSQFLCSYSQGVSHMTIYDFVQYASLAKMVCERNLFMALFPLDSWAFADKDRTKNIDNISKAIHGIEIRKGNCSDGSYRLNSEVKLTIIMKKGEDEPDEDLYIPHSNGVIEIGDNPLCKSIGALKMGYHLLRVPYKVKNFEPMAALFVNVMPHNWYDN